MPSALPVAPAIICHAGSCGSIVSEALPLDEHEIIRKTLRENPAIDPALRKVLEDKLKPAPAKEPGEVEDDEMLVVCGYWPSVINGSKLVLCTACKTRCCIAPSTQEQLKTYTGKVRMLCLKCFQANPPDDMPEALRAVLPKL